MVWYGMVEWLVEESTMSSFAALIQITMAIKKYLQCYGSVEVSIFSPSLELKYYIYITIQGNGLNRSNGRKSETYQARCYRGRGKNIKYMCMISMGPTR